MKASKLLFAVLALALSMASLATPQVYAQQTDPVSIANAWITAIGVYDFDAAVALLDDDSYLVLSIAPSGKATTYAGKDEIGGALRSYAIDNVRVDLVSPPQLVNGTVTWVERQTSDSLRQLRVASVDVTADAIIENGKIRSIVYELTAASALRIAAAQRAANSRMGMPRTGIGEQDVRAMLTLVLLGGATVLLGLGLALAARQRAYDS